MTSQVKPTEKLVTFTPEAVDQTLLGAVEQALAQPQFSSSFSDLCKQALWQFLLNPAPVPSATGVLQLAHQLIELQRQFIDFKAVSHPPEWQRFYQVESHLAQLQQQIERLETQMDQLFVPVVPEPEAVAETPIELDPVLSRLAPLLEDF
jgi:hypothetical protein